MPAESAGPVTARRISRSPGTPTPHRTAYRLNHPPRDRLAVGDLQDHGNHPAPGAVDLFRISGGAAG